jgi:hypothetical protein
MTVTPYEALVESASRLVGADTLDAFDAHNISDAASLVEQNRPVFESARHFLSQQCRVPLRYEKEFFADHSEDCSQLRKLARALRAKALFAASRGDYSAAALTSVDILELANAMRRGGLVVDSLISIAISGIALESLRKLRGNLNEATRVTLRDSLRSLEHEREPLAEIYARDRAWERTVGWEDAPCDPSELELRNPEECGLSEDEQRAILTLIQEFGNLPESEHRELQENQDRHVLALMRMLRVDLALRSWHAQTHSYPSSLALLVPEHLLEVPDDPFTGSSFIYRPVEGGTFLLYSTGPKKTDFGGAFGPWPAVAAGAADLGLDENDYWDSWQGCCATTVRRGVLFRMLSKLRTWWRAWRQWIAKSRKSK